MWGYTRRERPWAMNYEGIKKYFNATTPWRNGPGNIRPISHNRRRVNEYIRECADGSYECVLHSTPVVTYHPDGTVSLRHGGHITMMTASFAHTYSPVNVGCSLNRIVAGGYIMRRDTPLVFVGREYVIGALPQQRLELDKSKAAAARKHPRLREIVCTAEALNRLERRPSLSAYRDSSFSSNLAMVRYLLGDDECYEAAMRSVRVNDAKWVNTVAYFAFNAIKRVEVPLGMVLPPSDYDKYEYLFRGAL